MILLSCERNHSDIVRSWKVGGFERAKHSHDKIIVLITSFSFYSRLNPISIFAVLGVDRYYDWFWEYSKLFFGFFKYRLFISYNWISFYNIIQNARLSTQHLLPPSRGFKVIFVVIIHHWVEIARSHSFDVGFEKFTDPLFVIWEKDNYMSKKGHKKAEISVFPLQHEAMIFLVIYL